MAQPSPGFGAERARYAGPGSSPCADDDPELATARQIFGAGARVRSTPIDKALSRMPHPWTAQDARPASSGLLADHRAGRAGDISDTEGRSVRWTRHHAPTPISRG